MPVNLQATAARPSPVAPAFFQDVTQRNRFQASDYSQVMGTWPFEMGQMPQVGVTGSPPCLHMQLTGIQGDVSASIHSCSTSPTTRTLSAITDSGRCLRKQVLSGSRPVGDVLSGSSLQGTPSPQVNMMFPFLGLGSRIVAPRLTTTWVPLPLPTFPGILPQLIYFSRMLGPTKVRTQPDTNTNAIDI